MRLPAWGSWRSLLAAVGLVVLVCLLHGAALWHAALALAPPDGDGMRRLGVVYARRVTIAAVAPQATVAAAAPVAAHRPRRTQPVPAAGVAAAPASAASEAMAASAVAPAPASSAIALADAAASMVMPAASMPEPAASAREAGAPAASVPVAAASMAAAPLAAASAASAASAPAFQWPVSTRLRYRLNGWYRGELNGTAQVEWLRVDDRYQVHLEVETSVVSRRMSSEGRITAAGLLPERFEEVTKLVLVQPRVRRMRFTEREIVMPDGQAVPRVGAPGELQDTASQFIQMIYVFSTRPDLLRPGGRMTLELALTHRVRPYAYEVGAKEWVEAPGGGWLDAWPVRPQVAPEVSNGKDLRVEAWLAPRLQMLPVRIRIRQEGDNFLDLHIEQLPEQADPAR